MISSLVPAPGTEQGRVVPTSIVPVEGARVLSLGSDLVARSVEVEVGDYIEYVQEIDPESGALVYLVADVLGLAPVPAITGLEPFTLSDGNDIELIVDDEVVTATIETAQFVDIATATALELALALASQLDPVSVRLERGRVTFAGAESVEIVGGTLVAGTNMVLPAWFLDVLVDGTVVTSRRIEPKRPRRFVDIGFWLEPGALREFALRLALRVP